MTKLTVGKPKSQAHMLKLLTAIICTFALTQSCKTKTETSTDTNRDQISGQVLNSNWNALINKGYEAKKTGHNTRALQLFKEVCDGLSLENPKSVAHGSCLDDLASVYTRIGKSDKAAKLYDQAQKILSTAKGSDPRLIGGIIKRRALIEIMKKRNFLCAEPGEPKADSTLPYFPDIAKMQAALGKINPEIAVCHTGTPQAVTVRAIITGNGQILRAEARGTEADTKLGKCVVEKLFSNLPKAKLPKFQACFRGFTYPYMVGDHLKKTTPKNIPEFN